MEQDVIAALHEAEQRRESTERRLQQLTRMESLTEAERDEAVGLSNALSVLGLQIRRLRLDLAKSQPQK